MIDTLLTVMIGVIFLFTNYASYELGYKHGYRDGVKDTESTTKG